MGYFDRAIEERDDHLEHHGIKGQKWGVRRFENPDSTLTTKGKIRYGETSDLYNAKKGQLKSTMKSMGNTIAANVYGLNKKAYKNSNKTLSSMNAAKESEFRKKAEAHAQDMVKKSEAKKAYKEEYKKNLKDIRDKASLGEKITHNDATRRRAAKIMTKYKNVSMEEANKQAKKEAWRNTALIMAGWGAVTLGGMYTSKKREERRASASEAAYMNNLLINLPREMR